MDRLTVETEGAIARLTIRRPERRNAFDDEMIDEAVAALSELRRGDPRAVVIAGDGGVFCAGYDVRGIDPDQDPDRPLPDIRFERVIQGVRALDCPVIAAIEGDAFGGGLDLALACDLRVASLTARLAMTPARLGLIYSETGLARFLTRLGPAVTRRLFLLAEPVEATEALGLGIVDYLEPTERVRPRAEELALRIAQNAPQAVRGIRRGLQWLEERLALAEEQHELLDSMRLKSLASSDLKEGLAAFAERRPPRFSGA